jgi:hypothetical protein
MRELKSVRSKNSESEPRITRTTVFLTDALDLNLEALALTTGMSKGEHVRRAVTQYLEGVGLEPNKKPKIMVSY